MLDISGERVRVECGPVAVRASCGRLLFLIKFPQVNAVSDMGGGVLAPLVCQRDFLRGIRFLKSRLQA